VATFTAAGLRVGVEAADVTTTTAVMGTAGTTTSHMAATGGTVLTTTAQATTGTANVAMATIESSAATTSAATTTVDAAAGGGGSSSLLAAGVTPIIGTAFSLAMMALAARTATSTLKKIHAGNPCDKAEMLLAIDKNLASLPETSDLDDECRFFLSILSDGKFH